MTRWCGTFDGPFNGEPETLSIVAGTRLRLQTVIAMLFGDKKDSVKMSCRASLTLPSRVSQLTTSENR
jgi:hypothetical protein